MRHPVGLVRLVRLVLLAEHGAGRLEGPITLPVGLGGDPPQVSSHSLQRGDRVLCYTDGVIEERDAQGEPFGEERRAAVL